MITKIGLKTLILRHWGSSLKEPPRDAVVCQRICSETGWKGVGKKKRIVLLARYYKEIMGGDVPTPVVKREISRQKSAAKRARRDFYKSDAWRAVRYEALRLHGARCQCCGATAADGKTMHVDHIKPRHTHPHLSLVLANLQVLCEDCNLGKGARDDTDWRPTEILPEEAEAHLRSI